MLGVDKDSLTGRDAEEIGVKLVDTLEESTAARDIQVSESVGVPSRCRNRADTIGAISQHIPERAGAVAPGNRHPIPMTAIGSGRWANTISVGWLVRGKGSSARKRAARRSWDDLGECRG